ncbi:MAG: tetratricopeptide repeat-containing sensor histidine kinase [Bacteroidota bacterium]|nr:tetratricopeptide repeat-containing sensor histidine kinase [Bacteroidota bacterium]
MLKRLITRITNIKCIICLTLIFTFGVNSNLQAKEKNIDSLFAVSNNAKNDSDYLNTLFQISEIYSVSNPDTSIHYNKIVIKTALENDLFDMYYKATLLLGTTYKNIGKHTEAIKITLELLKVCEKKGYKDKQANCLTDLAEYCRASRQFKAGIEYSKQAIRIVKKTNNEKTLANVFNRLSAIHYELNEVKLSRMYIDSAIKLCEEINFLELMPNNLDILGAIYSNQGKYDKAITIYHKVIKINDEIGANEKENINTYINLSRAYYFSTAYDSGLFYARKSYKLAEIFNIPIYKENSAMLLAWIYAATNDYKNAYRFLDTTISVGYYLYNKNKNQQISELNKKYEIEKNIQKIKNQNLIIKQKKITNYFLIAGIVSLFILFIGFLFFYKNIKKKNILLNKKNEKILSQRNELQYFTKELEDANKMKDRFFSIIAHDLKSPISSLLGLSELLYEDFEDFDSNDVKKIIGTIYKASDNTLNLLDNLLEWSRTQTNKIKYKPSIVNINEIIQSNIELNKSVANIKSLKIIFEPKENVAVITDKNMFDTILRNFISNAIKFTSHGQIEIQTKITNEECIVSVNDTGKGMSEDLLSKMFKIDENTVTDGTNGEKGTGLGLILCKELVQMNQGKIEVESTLGKGSKFSFSIPLAKE